MNRFAALLAFTLPLGAPAWGADYLTAVKPIFVQHCQECHDAETREGGLRLDRGGGALRGGDGGPILVAGQPQQSRLLKILRGEDAEVPRMPPEDDPLTEDQLSVLADWIAAGAIVPDSELDLSTRTDHWAFQPIQRPTPPEVASAWPRNPIDQFILHRLRSERLTPSDEAERAVLARRVSLDLLGLPPSPEDVTSFVNDNDPLAYERLVDRYLASPAYGERWGRHWLDLARYADSNGFTRDFGREIWRYRDWVIAAINADQPFDQFTIEQFAGDLLPNPTLDQWIATGFHRNTLINEEGGTDPEQFRVDAVADRVETTGLVYLGLTLGCARCHQHKYDPITQREYYQLFAFLNDCDEPTIDAPYPWQRADLARRDELRQAVKKLEEELAQRGDDLLRAQLAWEETVTPEFRVTLPGPTQAALDKDSEKRDETERKLIADLFQTTDVAAREFPLVEEIADLRATEPVIPTTMVMRRRDEPRETRIHRRGNFLDQGDLVAADVPAILPSLDINAEQPTRLDFARWLVDARNPLTARVTVNRYWQRFFGRGLVETENDFGSQGAAPTHPELLDWLASEFVENGWSVKHLHRLIVTSATYRQQSRGRGELDEVDPDNRLLARQSRVRLDAEIVRDSALAVSGLLTRAIGGPSVFPPQPEGVFDFTQDPKPWNTETGANRFRRAMYTQFWRSSPYPALIVFDAPNGNVTCTRRIRSNTPLQALTLANDEQFVECARALAGRLEGHSEASDQDRARALFRTCLAREPRQDESQRLRDFVAAQRAAYENAEEAAARLAGAEASVERTVEIAVWTATARVLLNLDEFITRE